MTDDGKRTKEEDRASYRDGYERDAAAWRRRLAELEAAGLKDGDRAYDEAKAAGDALLTLLRAYGSKTAQAEQRPTRASEKRA